MGKRNIKRAILMFVASLMFIGIIPGMDFGVNKVYAATNYGANLVINGDGETSSNPYDFYPWTSDMGGLGFTDFYVDTPYNIGSMLNSSNGGKVFDYVWSGLSSSETLSQIVDISDISSNVDAGLVLFNLSGELRSSLSISGSTITLQLLDASNTVLKTYNLQNDLIYSWQIKSTGYTPVVASTRKLKVSMIGKSLDPNNDIQFDGIKLQLSQVQPTIVTGSASAISSTGVTLSGTVNANNVSTVVKFEYGTTTAYGNTVTATPSPVTGINSTSVSGVITGLTPNTTYHYRVNGTNGAVTTNGSDLTFKTTPLAVNDVSSTAADGTYKAGDTIPITVNFTNPVTVTGTPTLQLETGITDRMASYSSGSGSNTLIFNYTVQSGDTSLDLDYISVNALSLSGGTIKDSSATADAVLTLPSPGTAGSLGSNKNLVIDAKAPSVSSVVRASASPTNATSVGYTVTFDEAVTAVDTSDFSLTATGTAAGDIASITGSGTTYTVTVNNITGAGTLRLDLNSSGTGIVDAAGNAIASGYTTGEIYTIDTTIPAAVTGITLLDNDSNPGIDGRDFTIGFTDSTDDPLDVANYKIYIYKDGEAPADITAFNALASGSKLAVKTITATASTDGGAANLGSGVTTDSKGQALATGDYWVVVITTDSIGNYSFAEIASKVKITNDVLPTATTVSATNIGQNTATLNGSVNDNGNATTISFEYGLTTGYGSTATATPGSLSAGAGATSVSASLTGLTANTTYYFRVKAVNDVGTSNAVGSFFTTSIGAPGAPTIGTATAGDTQASVTFTAPTSDGGSAITGYTVTATPVAGGTSITAAGTVSPITVTGLTNGTAYTFTVAATNSAGTGAASAASNSATPKAAQTIAFSNPGTQNFGTSPTLTATATSGLTVTFSSGDTTVATITSGGTITFLKAGTAVINAYQAGNGSYLAATTVTRSFTVNPVVPGAPTIGTATAGDTQASVTFTAPTSDGGSAITGYTVTATPVAGGTSLTGTGTSSPIIVTGLTNGKAYALTVTATNSAGTGAASAASNHVTPIKPVITGGGGSTTTPTTVTGSVIDDKTGETVKGVEAQVTTAADGTKTVAVKSEEAILFKEPDGTNSSLTDTSKLSFSAPVTTETGTAAPNVTVTLKEDGTIQVSGLPNGSETKIKVTMDLGNGKKIVIGTIDIKVSSIGDVNLTSTLIDPYGTITDAATGKIIDGAKITLYYANTDRNKANGKVPGTSVSLPLIDGFKPNNNANPQVSDLLGSYGFMVYPTTDYYIVAVKDGYDQYTSPTISVEQEIVKWDFNMNKTAAPKPLITITRLAGAGRVDTALEIAKASYNGKLSNVVLATAENYPDALAGSVLAHKLNAPILLVGSSDAEQQKVLDYISANLDKAGTVYILGGTGAVSAAMENKVAANGFVSINRISGADRYETSARIVDAMHIAQGTPIVLVSGENYPDALSVSSAAALKGYPILLVKPNEIPANIRNEISYIRPSNIFIIGLQGAVNAAADSKATEAAGLNSDSVIRIGGVDRYETSLSVAKYFNLGTDNICIATGNNFPDALAGSAYAAKSNAAIMLVDNTLTDIQKVYLQGKELLQVTIFGGEGAVNSSIQQQLQQLYNK